MNTLKQTCDDLVEEYVHLAESGKGILDQVTTSIGLYYQYKWVTNVSGTIFTEYHDNKPPFRVRAFWRVMGVSVVSIDKVPHPKRPEAREKLEETLGSVTQADTKFDFDAKDIGATVKSVGEFLGTWLDGYMELTKIAFPETPEDIPTPSTTSWQSPFVVDRYARNVQLQYDAHVTTEETIAGLMSNCAMFLDQLSSHLATFSGLVREQEAYYTSLVTSDWIPEKTDITAFIDIIGNIGTKVVAFKDRQDKEATAMIETMLDAVKSILRIEELRADIQGMSRSGEAGWPLPNEVGISEQHGHSSDLLVFEAQYFRDHINTWGDLASDMYSVVGTVITAPAIAHMFLRWPSFGASTGAAITSLGTDIQQKALSRGSLGCRQLSWKLSSTIREYMAGEDLNEEEAKKIRDVLTG